jgi:hypothetical protein
MINIGVKTTRLGELNQLCAHALANGDNTKVEIEAHELQTFLMLAQAVQNERHDSLSCLERMAKWEKKEAW